MRFFDISAGAIAAAALLQGVVASPAQQPEGYGAAAATTSAATTYYTTMTVFRVETTVTATRNGSLTAYESTATESSAVAVPTTLASATIQSYGNSTHVHSSATPTGIISSTGAASDLQACSMAVAAIAGVVGLLMI
ncbi:hypothetical protein Slin15195_G005480 [Septoria linicola]|uniref:Uncharacterized protein n=1 Tax=Septoria linicola TaxID=215465 RepID=A0A9Q9AGL9_9PEZI|nr:hypothetical protein Slin14017_G005520 [Septoria linicola]USW47229.1 hypothetical protein Slin15195_G005480 [Septoria linicola]